MIASVDFRSMNEDIRNTIARVSLLNWLTELEGLRFGAAG